MPRGARTALICAAVSLVGLIATGLIALLDPAVQGHDALTLRGFTSLGDTPHLTALANLLAISLNPLSYAMLCGAFVWVAWSRGLPRLGLVVVGVMVASAATCVILKPLLAQSRYSGWLGNEQINPASWPSGTAAAAMTIALCAVLVAPHRWRPLAAALGSGLAVAVSYAVMILAWHFPSDVLGGFLVASLWVALGIAGLRIADARWPARSGRQAVAQASDMFAPVTLIALSVGAVALLLLTNPGVVATFAAGHRSFVVGALLIAGMAWSLATGLAYALRR